MTYTLRNHNELLGESALDYVRVIPKLRTGDLHPTPKGLTVFERRYRGVSQRAFNSMSDS